MTTMAMTDPDNRLRPPVSRAPASQWYVRRGSRVQGPYPKAQVHRFLLLGRILPTDRVSRDGVDWAPIARVEELVPRELHGLSSDTGWQRFIAARARVDERADQREADEDAVAAERRRQNDELTQMRIRDLWTMALGAGQLDEETQEMRSVQRPWGQSDYLMAAVLLLCLILVGALLLLD